MQMPDDVRAWVRGVFRACNVETAVALNRMPNRHEETLDHSLIAKINEYSAPILFPSKWIVRIDTHFLGGRRHFYTWEIADIGILIMFRRAGKMVKMKVALLQSKRLYPVEQEYDEAERVDYEVGFARLFKPDYRLEAITSPRVFTFTDESRYTALKTHADQYEAVQKYEKESGIPVYYLLYHPGRIPYAAVIPRVVTDAVDETVEIGARVLPSESIRRLVKGQPKDYAPRYGEVKNLSPKPVAPTPAPPGWLIEEFIADLAIDCKVGHVVKSLDDEGLQRVFFSRNGPIAAAIAVTFDIP